MTDTKRARRVHWPALDGWRGFTIWFAISVHAGYFTAGGVLSLDTFFVLSGFLITGLLLREWLRHDEEHIDLPAFWARRARRLLPALFVVLAAVLVYAAFLASPLGLDRVRGDVLGSLFYVANWRFILSGQSYFSSVHHAVAGAAPVVARGRGAVLPVLATDRARRAVARAATVHGDGRVVAVGVVAFVGAIASAVWMASLYVPGGDPSRVYYGTDTRAQAMLMGAALAVIVTLHGPVRSRVGRTAAVGRGGVRFRRRRAAVVRVGFGSRCTTCSTDASVCSRTRSRTAVVHLASHATVARCARAAASKLRPVRWVGAISYEMYLWHWPTVPRAHPAAHPT